VDLRIQILFLREHVLDLKRKHEKALKVVHRWAYAEGLEALAYSSKIVPVDTGALKSTGKAEKPEQSGDIVTCTIGYGGVAGASFIKKQRKKSDLVGPVSNYVGYARRVHNDLRAIHKHGEAKFLEKGLLSRSKPCITTLRLALSDVLESHEGLGGS
jgi:hypothetical protein